MCHHRQVRRASSATVRALLLITLLAALSISPASAHTFDYDPAAPESLPLATWEYDQLHTAIAYSPKANKHLAVWEDHHWGWGDDWDIYGRFVSTSAVADGAMFGIAWADAKHRLAPDVVHNTVTDQFMVAYELEYAANDHDIYARHVSPSGQLSTVELPVVTTTAYDSDPAIAYNSVLNQYLVVWQRSSELGRHDIYGQRLHANGAPYGGEFLIYAPSPMQALSPDSPSTPFDAIEPDVAFSPILRNYLVVWQDKLAPSTTFDIRAQLVGEAGYLDGDDIAIATWEHDQLKPRVAHNARTDEFLVVWEDHHWAWGADSDIYGARVRGDGVLASGIFGISWEGEHRRLAPDVAYDEASGDMLVTWASETTTTNRDIAQRLVRADGSLPSGEAMVDAHTADQTGPVVASSGNRSFVLIWQDERDGGMGVNLYAAASAFAAPTRDLSVAYIEVTQAIQCKDNANCADNSVPLIAGKTTFARAYVKVNGTATADTPNVTGIAIAREANGAVITGTLLNGPIVARLAPDRAKDNDTLNFVFEANKLDQIGVIEVTVNPTGAVAEDNPANNKRVTLLNFQSTPALHVVAVRVQYFSGGQWYLVSPTMPLFMRPYSLNVLPISKLVWHYPPAPLIWPFPLDTEAQWVSFLNALRDMKNKDTSLPPQAHWYGMLPFKQVGWASGLGDMPGYTAMGRVPLTHENLEDAADIMVHELGHNWGRPHAPCSVADPDAHYPYPNAQLGDVGWDPLMARGGKSASVTPGYAVPASTADFMSYCQDEWVSEYTYRGILSYRGSAPVGATESTTSSLAAEEQVAEMRSYLFASGTVTADAAALDPFTVLTRTVGFSDHAGAGPYRIIVRGSMGEALFERRFTPITVKATGAAGPSAPTEAAAAPFYEVVPWPPQATRVEIWVDAAMIGQRVPSIAAPVVQVTAPAAGTRWPASGVGAIRWSSSDADGDALTHDVAFSRDNGQTWQLIATRVQSNQLDVDTGQFAGAAQARIRVFATDGLRTSESSSDVFEIASKMPQAAIAAPVAGSVLAIGQPIALSGSAYDAEDGLLSDDQLSWASSRDGQLGTGESLIVNLSRGLHTITLQAADSNGGTGVASVVVAVGPIIFLPLIMR
jgi:hypothetical protein